MAVSTPGGTAEFVLVPHADSTLVKMTDGIAHNAKKHDASVALTDVMATGHHGGCAQTTPGSTVVVVGDFAVVSRRRLRGVCSVPQMPSYWASVSASIRVSSAYSICTQAQHEHYVARGFNLSTCAIWNTPHSSR